jgi:hypothetical protein
MLCSHCKKNTATGNEVLFDSIPLAKPVVPMVREISGIVNSTTNSDLIWAHEDSGNPTQLYGINYDGTVTKKIYIKNVTNRDWEDIGLLDGSVYIGDIGDNNQVQTEYSFYQFSEPSPATDTVHTVQQIRFQYPDGPHDAEAFIADPLSKNIFIITKRDNQSRVYKLTAPFASANILSYVGSLPYNGVVSATISTDGKEILVKTYSSVYYYSRNGNEPIEQVLQKAYKALPYQPEPQGEAICFAKNNSGFFTLSEKGFASWVNLNFYKRK